MKNIIKIASLVLVLACFVACDDSNDLGFRPTENVGWIQFPEPANPIQVNPVNQPTFAVGIDVQVPIVENDFTITYDLVPVSGLDPNVIFSSDSGSIVSPAGYGSYAGPDNNTGIEYSYTANIEFDATQVPLLTELMIFDVVLKTSSDPNITVGLAGVDKPLSQRVVILCAVNPEMVPDTYFVGDYAIADDVASIGPGNGTENFGAGTVTLSVDPLNPRGRLFDTTALPAFTGGAPFPASIVLAEDDTVTLGGYIGLGISCDGATEYAFDAGAPGTLGNWNICEDTFITISYTEDPNGSCGGPFESTFTLTKL